MLQALTSGAQPVTKIAGGAAHSLFLKRDGSLWAMGDNEYGGLGDGTYNNTNRPEQIVATNVWAISAGGWHSLFLKTNGSLWTMGDNIDGELGDGTKNTVYPYDTNSPEQIVASNITAIAAGFEHSLFIKSDGSLWGMGRNYDGELGDGAYNNTNRPEQIVASNITAIAAGYGHSLFLKSNGSLWVMGINQNGQLGDGTYNNTNRPEEIMASNVMAIAAGFGHSVFLKRDGSLWAMGYNEYGELGDGTYNSANLPEQIVASNVTAIAAGFYFTLFLKSDGSLWAMGDNGYGQLGDGTYGGPYSSTPFPEQIVASGVTAIAAGYDFSMFLKNDGSLWAMGDDRSGELGDGTYNGNGVNLPEQILAAYNRITGQLIGGTNMQLSFVGVANANYALDRSSSLLPPNWIPQVTNQASSYGPILFINAPDATTNNFWRIRSVP